jgi:hypothetical protein
MKKISNKKKKCKIVKKKKECISKAREMAQWLSSLTALPKVLISIPANHMVAHNCLQWYLMLSSCMSEDSNNVLTYIK